MKIGRLKSGLFQKEKKKKSLEGGVTDVDCWFV
jgi:hypothetical protein